MGAQSVFHSVILCVDNDGTGIELRRRVLEKLGFQTLVATSAEQALNMFRENHVDLVLMENIGPTIGGGPTLAASFKTLKPDVPVAIFTADAMVSPEDMLLADVCITKLVSVDELVRIIEGLLPKGRAIGAS